MAPHRDRPCSACTFAKKDDLMQKLGFIWRNEASGPLGSPASSPGLDSRPTLATNGQPNPQRPTKHPACCTRATLSLARISRSQPICSARSAPRSLPFPSPRRRPLARNTPYGPTSRLLGPRRPPRSTPGTPHPVVSPRRFRRPRLVTDTRLSVTCLTA